MQFWIDVMNPGLDRDADGKGWYTDGAALIAEAESGGTRIWNRKVKPGDADERNIVIIHIKGDAVRVMGEARLIGKTQVEYEWIADATRELAQDPIGIAQLQPVSHGPLVANSTTSRAVIEGWLLKHPNALEPSSSTIPTGEVELLTEARRRRQSEVIARDGQSLFRQKLLERDGRCVISAVASPGALEAAHITPVGDSVGGELGGPDSLDNGLTLRADLHRLFDRGLLIIDDSMCARFAPSVRNLDPEYENLDGRSLIIGPGIRPNRDRLRANRLAVSWFSEG